MVVNVFLTGIRGLIMGVKLCPPARFPDKVLASRFDWWSRKSCEINFTFTQELGCCLHNQRALRLSPV
jgi:hypothetical protein